MQGVRDVLLQIASVPRCLWCQNSDIDRPLSTPRRLQPSPPPECPLLRNCVNHFTSIYHHILLVSSFPDWIDLSYHIIKTMCHFNKSQTFVNFWCWGGRNGKFGPTLILDVDGRDSQMFKMRNGTNVLTLRVQIDPVKLSPTSDPSSDLPLAELPLCHIPQLQPPPQRNGRLVWRQADRHHVRRLHISEKSSEKFISLARHQNSNSAAMPVAHSPHWALKEATGGRRNYSRKGRKIQLFRDNWDCFCIQYTYPVGTPVTKLQ